MTCSDLRPLISAYVDDEVWPAQREMIALHLERCSTCQTYLIAHQRARRLLTTCSCPGWAPDLREAVRARLADERRLHQVTSTIVHCPHRSLQRVLGPGLLVLTGLSCFLAGRMGSVPTFRQAISPLTLDTRLSSCALAQLSPTPVGGASGLGLAPTMPPSPHHLIMVLPCPASTGTGEVMVVDSILPVSPDATQLPPDVHRCRDMRCVQQAVGAAIGPAVQEVTLPVMPGHARTEPPRSRKGLPLML